MKMVCGKLMQREIKLGNYVMPMIYLYQPTE
jgi:hypothetical protein